MVGADSGRESGMIDIVRDKPAKPQFGMRRAPATRRHGRSKRASHDVAIVVYDGFTPFELGVVCEVSATTDGWRRVTRGIASSSAGIPRLRSQRTMASRSWFLTDSKHSPRWTR